MLSSLLRPGAASFSNRISPSLSLYVCRTSWSSRVSLHSRSTPHDWQAILLDLQQSTRLGRLGTSIKTPLAMIQGLKNLLLCMSWNSVASFKRSSLALVYRGIHRLCVCQLPGNQGLSHHFQGWVLGDVLQLVRELRLEDGRGGVLGDEALLEAVRRLLGSCSAAPGR